MEKFTQNLLRLSLSFLCLTVPITSFLLISEYLSYKKIIIETGEDIVNEAEDFIDKLKRESPELNEWLP